MAVPIPDKERMAGISYAVTRDGVELPVIDVTHPSFALDCSPAALQRLRAEAAAQTTKWLRRPAWLRRLLLFLLTRRSTLLRGLRSSNGTFLSGMNTYLLKLSPPHLASSFAAPIDKRLAQGAAILEVRVRLQLMSELSAERLGQQLDKAAPGAPLFLLNIAGGPAMDTLNALQLCRRETPEALAGRAIQIAVLDLHDEGPHFGGNALAAWQATDAPLHGLSVAYQHRHYDWNHPDALRESFVGVNDDAVCLGSSEGGLFHYADDATIRANLEVLHAVSGPDFAFCGSLGVDTPETRHAMVFSGAAVRYFKPETFAALVHSAGWRIDRQVESLRSMCVRLVKR